MRQFLLTTALVLLGLFFLGLSIPMTALAAPFHPDAWEAMSEAERIRLSPEPSNRALAVLSQATASNRRWTSHPRTLVLLVDFEDKPSSPSYDPLHFESILFSLDRAPFGSLRDYFREATYNKIDVTGEVYGWFRMPLSYADYADGQQGFGSNFPRSAKGLAHHALEAAVEAGVDITQFDSDGPDGIPNSGDDDGVIDALMIVHAGFGTERTRSLDDIRSHYWTTAGDLQIDGIRVPDYAMVPELENVGIMVHEYGHLLGAPDLYDLSGRGNGLGWFSVMAWAIWYNNGREPGAPDPYTRMKWGVLQPQIPGGDEPRLRLPAINDKDYALRLWTKGEVGKEYFLVEYRKPVGIDRYLFGDGLLIYHVDERVARQDNPNRYMVRLVQADGHRSLEGGLPRNVGDPGDFFPGPLNVMLWNDETEPNAFNHAGEPTQVEVRILEQQEDAFVVGTKVGRFVAKGPDLRVHWENTRPGHYQARFQNLGTRLEAGQFRVELEDARVRRVIPSTVAVPELPTLGVLSYPVEFEVEFDPNTPSFNRTVVLGGRWTSEQRELETQSVLPLPQNEDRVWKFSERGDLGSYAIGDGRNGWEFGNFGEEEDGAWRVGGQNGFQPRLDCVFELDPLVVGNYAEVSIRHFLDIQAETEFTFSGGFLEVFEEVSESWRRVEPAGGYPKTFGLTDGNNYPGQPAWAGREGWEEVEVPLVGYAGTVRLRFHFVSDFAGSQVMSSWVIDEVKVLSWDHTHSAWLQPSPVAGSGDLILRAEALTDGVPASGLQLVQESPGSRFVLGTWWVEESLNKVVHVPGLREEQTYRWTLASLDGKYVSQPLQSRPSEAPSRLLSVPTIVRASVGAWFEYSVPGAGLGASESAATRIELFDVRGRLLRTLVDGDSEVGLHRVLFEPVDRQERLLKSGVYFTRIAVAGRTPQAERFIVLP